MASPFTRLRRRIAVAALAALSWLALAPATALAQRAATGITPFSGTLQKIYESGVIRIGHRLNSPPFAFLDAGGRPIGYSLDLCDVVVEEVGLEVRRELRVQYVPVTPENRFDQVTSGAVDLECGSTTHTRERAATVAFSPTIFVTGTKLLVKRTGNIRSVRDLDGKTIVLTSGTVHAEALPQLAARRKIAPKFVNAQDHDASFAMLADGRADAFANDDVQLYGMVAARNAAADYRVTGDFLSYADYALMMRKDDPDFAAVVQRAFQRLAGSREVRDIYRKWFQRPLPSGVRLDIPMSPHLEHLFQLQGLAAD